MYQLSTDHFSCTWYGYFFPFRNVFPLQPLGNPFKDQKVPITQVLSLTCLVLRRFRPYTMYEYCCLLATHENFHSTSVFNIKFASHSTQVVYSFRALVSYSNELGNKCISRHLNSSRRQWTKIKRSVNGHLMREFLCGLSSVLPNLL